MNDRLPHERGFHISWDQIHRDSRALAWRLEDREWRAILAITRGGLVPAMIVARELDIRTIDTISVKSYKGVGSDAGQGQLQVLKKPDDALMGDGEGIHWPAVDEDVSVAGLLVGARSHPCPPSDAP